MGYSKITGVLWNEAGSLEGAVEVLQELRKLVRSLRLALPINEMLCLLF